MFRSENKVYWIAKGLFLKNMHMHTHTHIYIYVYVESISECKHALPKTALHSKNFYESKFIYIYNERKW